MAERNISKSQVNISEKNPEEKNVRIQIVLLHILLIIFSAIIACSFAVFCSKNCEIRFVNKVFMIGCMTCPWAPTASETKAQSGQRNHNDGVTAPNTQRLHQRLGHINRTLHADIVKPTILEKTFNNLQKINCYVFMKNK